MSKYKQFRVDRVRDYPLASRQSKVSVASFGALPRSGSLSALIDSLPDILAGRDLRLLVSRIHEARDRKRSLIWAFGGHVIKVGVGPIIIDLMKRGFVTALATNGAGVIHDFEIALAGRTSEDVGKELTDGSFGMARETGELLNQAIRDGSARNEGIGEAVGAFLDSHPAVAYPECSLLLQAYRCGVPVTVHVAIGTDIIHTHPKASGEALGRSSLIDFHIFAQNVCGLNDGGVLLNLGSAVIIPEVFLKAVTLVRNSLTPLDGFTTANLDFIQHYRPTQNIVRRPVAGTGTGIALTGHHEIMVPLLAALLVFGTEDSRTSRSAP